MSDSYSSAVTDVQVEGLRILAVTGQMGAPSRALQQVVANVCADWQALRGELGSLHSPAAALESLPHSAPEVQR